MLVLWLLACCAAYLVIYRPCGSRQGWWYWAPCYFGSPIPYLIVVPPSRGLTVLVPWSVFIFTNQAELDVCPSVRLCTKSFSDLNKIWHEGSSQWVIHDSMPYDPIECQGDGGLNFAFQKESTSSPIRCLFFILKITSKNDTARFCFIPSVFCTMPTPPIAYSDNSHSEFIFSWYIVLVYNHWILSMPFCKETI